MSENWTYHGVLSIQISGDVTDKYWPGQKLKITQSDGTKYFIIDDVQYVESNTILALNGMGFYLLIDSDILAHQRSILGSPQGFPSVPRLLKLGSSIYEANYNYPESSYIVMDRETDGDDCSVVFRTAGSARAEFGLITDNDFHFKTVEGEYPNETFVDRLILRTTGEVDAFGGILRSYGTSGVHSLIAGNSNRSAGAGLELTYDQDNTQAWIQSIEHDNCYRNLNVGGQNILFYTGAITLAQILLLGSDGNAVFSGDVAAASFTDNTPAFEEDAIDAIKKISSDKKGNILHSTLPKSAQREYITQSGEKKIGRDIGNMISVLTKAVQELTELVEQKDEQIKNLISRIEKLEKKS